MASENHLGQTRTSLRRASISSVFEDRRASNFDALRHDVDDIKEAIRRLYKQLDSYDEKRLQLNEGMESLKRANRDHELKVRELLDIFQNPPPTIISSYSSKTSNRLGFQTYDSNLSSRSSSRSDRGNAAVFDDDYEEGSSFDDYANERNFTKSVENIDDESSEA